MNWTIMKLNSMCSEPWGIESKLANVPTNPANASHHWTIPAILARLFYSSHAKEYSDGVILMKPFYWFKCHLISLWLLHFSLPIRTFKCIPANSSLFWISCFSVAVFDAFSTIAFIIKFDVDFLQFHAIHLSCQHFPAHTQASSG